MATATEKGKFSMLGLGDIVLPGLFVALMLRFDASRAQKNDKEGKANGAISSDFAKPFFFHNLLAYGLGLGIVIWMMYFMDMAQVCGYICYSDYQRSIFLM